MEPTHLQNIRQHGQIHGMCQDQMMTGGLQIGLGQIGCPVRDSCRQKAQMITRSGSRRAGPEVSDFGGLRRGCRCIVSRRSSRTFRHDWIRRWLWRRRAKREKQQTRCTDRAPGISKDDFKSVLFVARIPQEQGEKFQLEVLGC